MTDTSQSVETFSISASPDLCLIDVAGRRNPVADLSNAEQALAAANILQTLAGKGTATWLMPMEDAEGAENDCVAVFYRSRNGRPSKSEIARAAKVIARSEVRSTDHEGEDLFITGSRAVIYAETCPKGRDTICFLVSRSVWYNENRVTIGMPSNDALEELFLDDINARLTEGTVSLPRG